MAKLPDKPLYDLTLTEVDKAIIAKAKLRRPSNSIGMSSIGKECWREIFYSFRNSENRTQNIKGTRAAEDGNIQEDVMAERLRMLPYIELITEDPDNLGEQINVNALLGHFKGFLDGMIHGILEAPKTWHVWEHKCKKEVGPGGFNKLVKLRDELGEKNALKEWNIEYYAQAQMYMHLIPATRHYMTVSTPGGRDHISIRTDYDKKYAESCVEKAKSIIFDKWNIPNKIQENPDSYICRFCDYKEICHSGLIPLSHCKTCRYSKPVKDQQWLCELKEEIVPRERLLLTNCSEHIYNQALIPELKFIEHKDDYATYKTNDGLIIANCCANGMPDDFNIDTFYTSKELREKIQNVRNLNKSIIDVQKTFDGEIDEKNIKTFKEV